MWNQIFNVELEKVDGTTQHLGTLETSKEHPLDEAEATNLVMEELLLNKDLMVYQWRGKVIPMSVFAGFNVTLSAAWSE